MSELFSFMSVHKVDEYKLFFYMIQASKSAGQQIVCPPDCQIDRQLDRLYRYIDIIINARTAEKSQASARHADIQ